MLKNTLKFAGALLASAMLLVACGGQANAQSLPAQPTQQFDNQLRFGNNQTVDVLHARYVDYIGGNWTVTDHAGNVKTGSFTTANAFYSSPAFSGYVRTTYNGGYRWWNTFGAGYSCSASNETVIFYSTGQAVSYADNCGVQQLVYQRGRQS